MCGPKLFSLTTTFLTHMKQDEEMLGNILDCPMCRKNSLRHLFAQFIGYVYGGATATTATTTITTSAEAERTGLKAAPTNGMNNNRLRDSILFMCHETNI